MHKFLPPKCYHHKLFITSTEVAVYIRKERDCNQPGKTSAANKMIEEMKNGDSSINAVKHGDSSINAVKRGDSSINAVLLS